MALEQLIKDFVKQQGVDVVGIAGPERLNGPPSLDPTYTLPKSRSIICMAMPMDVNAIDDFLGKRSPTPHNLDQIRGNQRMHRKSRILAEYLSSLGYQAREVPSNNTYRRSLDMLSLHPSFSHRFGAVVTGIGAQGWSGNVMTHEYGAAVYLGTVVTDAILQSDPMLPPRHFIDNRCMKCKLCEKCCASGMFLADEEEYVLINGELHPRGHRRNIDLCNVTCFGLHGLSRDKKWTTWGKYWIRDWIGDKQDPNKKRKIRSAATRMGASTGESARRYDIIRKVGSILYPEEVLESRIPDYENLPKDKRECLNLLRELVEQPLKIQSLDDPNVLTCGHCSLVCGSTHSETQRRYRLLMDSGLVVPGPEGRMVNCDTYEEACEIKKRYPLKVTRQEMRKDAIDFATLWSRLYVGVEPMSIMKGRKYDRALKKAVYQTRNRSRKF